MPFRGSGFCISTAFKEKSNRRGQIESQIDNPKADPQGLKATQMLTQESTHQPCEQETRDCCNIMVTYPASGSSLQCSSNYDTSDFHAKQGSY